MPCAIAKWPVRIDRQLMLLDGLSTKLCSYAMTCATLCAPCDPYALRIISNDELPSSQVAGATSSGCCHFGAWGAGCECRSGITAVCPALTPCSSGKICSAWAGGVCRRSGNGSN